MAMLECLGISGEQGDIALESFSWTEILAKIIGYAIILGSAVVEVPQIINIVKAKNTQGLSKKYLYLSAFALPMAFLYPHHHNDPFSAYGENVLISIQTYLILFFHWKYSHEKWHVQAIGNLLYFGHLILFIFFDTWVPEFIWESLYLILPQALSFSMLDQIILNYKNKGTGELSFHTTLLNLLGSLARIFTTLTEVEGFLMLFQVMIIVIINLILFLQILWYSGVNYLL